jgi:hypothetical protein
MLVVVWLGGGPINRRYHFPLFTVTVVVVVELILLVRMLSENETSLNDSGAQLRNG